MKTLGSTPDGNYIVEMSADEHWAFIKLEASINQSQISSLISYHRQSLSGINLAPVFQALDELVGAKLSINRIKEYVNFLDKALGN